MSSLEVRVLVDLGGAERVSSVDGGGRGGADVGLVGKLGLVLAVVQGGGGQDAVAHADWNLVDEAGRVAPVLDSVARRALRRHQVGHGARGAQGSGGRVGVEVGLTGQVRGRQVRVDISSMGGTAVMEGVRGLSGDGGGDVGLLAPVSAVSLGYHVLLSLQEKRRNESQLGSSGTGSAAVTGGSTRLAEIERLLLLLLEGVGSQALLSVGPASSHSPSREVIIARRAVERLELVRRVLMGHGICSGEGNGEVSWGGVDLQGGSRDQAVCA